MNATRDHTVPAVNKALELMRLLANGEAKTTTAQLAQRLRIPRTTCYRILRSLSAADWVRPGENGEYQVSLGLMPMLRSLRPFERFADAVQVALDGLARRERLTAKVSVRQGDYAVTLARSESPMETSVAVRLGAAFHLALGSSGAVLLSELPEQEVNRILDRAPPECWQHQRPAEVIRRIAALRAVHYCADLGTFRPTFHAVSASVRGTGNRTLAAVTLIGFPQELAPERIPALGGALLEAAREMQQALGRLPDTGGQWLEGPER